MTHGHGLDDLDMSAFALSLDLGVRLCYFLAEVLLVLVLQLVELLDRELLALSSGVGGVWGVAGSTSCRLDRALAARGETERGL